MDYLDFGHHRQVYHISGLVPIITSQENSMRDLHVFLLPELHIATGQDDDEQQGDEDQSKQLQSLDKDHCHTSCHCTDHP